MTTPNWHPDPQLSAWDGKRMPLASKNRQKEINLRYRLCGIKCLRFSKIEIASLSDYFSVFQSLLEDGKLFWFRGHSNSKFNLSPAALRYRSESLRSAALGIISDMKRFMGMKLLRPPHPDDHLGWIQVAQHYGLPTRLLDWTQNAAVALFFACSKDPDKDGLVAVFNPIELNQRVDPRLPRVLDYERDSSIINPYFKLGPRLHKRGKHTIALNPTWNNERIALQHGCFTLHGSRQFELDSSQASSLVYVPILKEHKSRLMHELGRVGVGEMFIFPEAEHVCNHLRRMANL